MNIRPASEKDAQAVLNVLDEGRRQMREEGNFSQWTCGYPSIDTVREDIALGRSYVVEESGKIVATFVLREDPEPTYEVIYDGKWRMDCQYGTIHRIAKIGGVHGIFGFILQWCCAKIGYIRIDTHHDNRTMMRVLERHGFVRCGRILLADGSPRVAYDFVSNIS